METCLLIGQVRVKMDTLRNDMLSENKFTRKKSFENMLKLMKEAEEPAKYCRELFDAYQVYILKCFRDESELCRELSMDVIMEMIRTMNPNDYYLTYIFPVMVERIGTPELVEESEELRLRMIGFLKEILGVYLKSEFLLPFVDDILEVLLYSCEDKYPKVKLVCCECVVMISEECPRILYEKGSKLTKGFLKMFTHRHFKVRVAAVEAIGGLIMGCRNGVLEDSAVPLAERLFDPVQQVRQAVIKVTAHLLMEYRDRYSFFYKLLPLILTGLCDDVYETRQLADKLWRDVGKRYAEENEKDIKDESDYCFADENPNRPTIGCRALVKANCTKIINGLRGEFRTTWNEDILVRSSQLLQALAIHAESNVTMSLGELIPDVVSSCARTGGRAADALCSAAETLGFTLSSSVWLQVCRDVLTTPPIHLGNVRIITAFTSGCSRRPDNELLTIRPILSELLSEPHVSRSIPSCSKYIIESATILLNVEGFRDIKIDGWLTTACLSAIAITRDPLNDTSTQHILDSCWLHNDHSVEVCDIILDSLNGDPSSWTEPTPDRRVLDILLRSSTNSTVLSVNKLIKILEQLLVDGCDLPARLATYTALTKSIENWSCKNINTDSSFYDFVIDRIICPNLVWRAGRGGEAIRAVSVRCLATILRVHKSRKPLELVDSLVSLLEDATRHSRRFSAECIELLSPMPNVEVLKKVYQPLLDRLDDECDTVRLASASAVATIFNDPPSDLEPSPFEPHLKHILETLFVHLDDEDPELRPKLEDAVRGLSKIDPEYVTSHSTSARHLFVTSETND